VVKNIPIRGVIGEDVTVDSFNALLDGVTAEDSVVFDISSPGGSVLVGFEIYNAIKNMPTKDITFEINGIAASIASIIVMAGAKIHASEFSLFMIHKAATGIEGNSLELKQQIEILEKIDALLVDTYYGRNQANGTEKLTKDQIVEMMTAETWLTPAEGVKYGFIDKVINKTADVSKIAAQFKPTMNHLQKIKAMLLNNGRPQIQKEDVESAMMTALAGKQYSNLSEEEVNTFLATVKSLMEQKLGGTLTEEEMSAVNAALNEAVSALAQQEAASSTDGQMQALKQQMSDLKNMVETIAKSTVESGQHLEALAFEITNLKKQTRTFGKKPFVNESTKLNIGASYIDPYAKHRQQMKEIEEKTRNSKNLIK